MSQTHRASPAERRRSRAGAPLLAMILAFLAVVAVIIASERGGPGHGPSEASDEIKYHLPVIDEMRRDLPRVDLAGYGSATSPGYHLVMAAISAPAPEAWRRDLMRALNALIGLGLVLWVWRVAARFAAPAPAVVLAAIVACNAYVLGGAAFLTTDNAGLLLAMGAVGLAVAWPFTPGRGAAMGALATAAVGVRQIHLWVAAPVAAAGLLASPLAALAPRWLRPERDDRAWLSVAIGAAAALAPALLLAWFVWLWGGLMPPAYADLHGGGPNPAGPALGLALFAVAATPLLGAFPWRRLREAALRPSVALGALAGLAVATAAPTSYLLKARAYGWLWQVVRLTPDVADRSALLALLAALGGACVVVLLRLASDAGRRPAASLLCLSLLGWLLAQSANAMAWQRYFEPATLIGAAWLWSMARPLEQNGRPAALRWWVGPAALCALQATVTAATLVRELIQAPPARF